LQADIALEGTIAANIIRYGIEKGDYRAENIRPEGLSFVFDLVWMLNDLFICNAGRIATPPKSTMLLPGVTRDLVLDLARGVGLPADERPISADELTAADEVWITSSTREVVPVTRIDGVPIGDGTPGPIWRQVDRLYQDCKADLRGYRV